MDLRCRPRHMSKAPIVRQGSSTTTLHLFHHPGPTIVDPQDDHRFFACPGSPGAEAPQRPPILNLQEFASKVHGVATYPCTNICACVQSHTHNTGTHRSSSS